MESLKAKGIYNDFLPNIVETLKTPDGYVAVPWALDPQVLWYRKSALEAINADLPKTWDELLETGKRAAAKGYFGFGVSGGTGIAGPQTIMSFMINNGGGLFNEAGELDVLSDRNIEATEFVIEMIQSALTDPGAVSLRDDDPTDQWRRKKVAFGFQSSGLNQQISDDDVLVADPLVGPHGDTGALHYVNDIMMYTNTPSQAESEAFVAYFLQNMHVLWEKQLVTIIPALQSVAQLPAFTADSQNAAIVKKWQPISKTIAAKATSSTASHASIDGGQGLADFAQTVLGAKTTARDALVKLHDALSPLIHP